MTKQPNLTERQIKDLQELMALPEDVRTKLIYIATGLVMAAQIQNDQNKSA
jgi:hypothetical protein